MKRYFVTDPLIRMRPMPASWALNRLIGMPRAGLSSGNGAAVGTVRRVCHRHPRTRSLDRQSSAQNQRVGALPGAHRALPVFAVPSAVNGFYSYVKRNKVAELDMSAGHTLKYIVSMEGACGETRLLAQ
ncbi:MAG TPA: hypothetical protein PKC12_07405 [Thiobacillaceae bacterium]|nr:hypothetical protein [Thiobacillaceae bacterium]